MRSTLTLMKRFRSQLNAGFVDLAQYCNHANPRARQSLFNTATTIASIVAKHNFLGAPSDLETNAPGRSFVGSGRSPSIRISTHDGRKAQADISKWADEKGTAGGRYPSNRGQTAIANAKVATAIGDAAAKLALKTSRGRREWNKENDEHSLYGIF